MSLNKVLYGLTKQINFKNALVKLNFSAFSTFYNKTKTHSISNNYYTFSTFKKD
jgi:hypothetical protein